MSVLILSYNINYFKFIALKGTITSVDVSTNAGVGQQNARIVTFELFDDAQNIIKQFNGCIWQDRTLEIREAHLSQFDGVYYGSNHFSSSQNIDATPTQTAPVHDPLDLEAFEIAGFEFHDSSLV